MVSAISHQGQKFNEVLVRSCIGSKISAKPRCAYTQGPKAQLVPSALTHSGQEFTDAPRRSCAGAKR